MSSTISILKIAHQWLYPNAGTVHCGRCLQKGLSASMYCSFHWWRGCGVLHNLRTVQPVRYLAFRMLSSLFFQHTMYTIQPTLPKLAMSFIFFKIISQPAQIVAKGQDHTKQLYQTLSRTFELQSCTVTTVAFTVIIKSF